MQQAAQDGAALAVFPELGLTGYTCSDLFLQQPLLDAAEQGLRDILRASETLELVAVVGLPVRVDGALYNCAAVVCHGALLGLVPKTHLPNYAEFYELRHFTPAPAETRSVTLCGTSVPFGTDLLFRCREMPDFCLGVEICEDLWAPLPPSTRHALAGATVLANLSASDETVGKAEYRRQLVGQQSARLLSAYLYADAGHGESTTDMVFAAHDLICENGALLAEAKPADGQKLRLAIVTGAEGGFAAEEAEMAAKAGARTVGLGPRILRCETAPLAVLASVMTLTGNLE